MHLGGHWTALNRRLEAPPTAIYVPPQNINMQYNTTHTCIHTYGVNKSKASSAKLPKSDLFIFFHMWLRSAHMWLMIFWAWFGLLSYVVLNYIRHLFCNAISVWMAISSNYFYVTLNQHLSQFCLFVFTGWIQTSKGWGNPLLVERILDEDSLNKQRILDKGWDKGWENPGSDSVSTHTHLPHRSSSHCVIKSRS